MFVYAVYKNILTVLSHSRNIRKEGKYFKSKRNQCEGSFKECGGSLRWCQTISDRSFRHCDFHHLWNKPFGMTPVSCGTSFNAFNALEPVVFHLVKDTSTTRTSVVRGFHIHWRSLQENIQLTVGTSFNALNPITSPLLYLHNSNYVLSQSRCLKNLTLTGQPQNLASQSLRL